MLISDASYMKMHAKGGAHGLSTLKKYLSKIVDDTGRQFVAVIDEWDAPIRREGSTADIQRNHLEFLRSLFKSDITQKVFAAAYMTGILPIKKDGTQSAISEFKEYSVIRPKMFAPYVGFLEDEVRAICEKKEVSFEKMKEWYNGYHGRERISSGGESSKRAYAGARARLVQQ